MFLRLEITNSLNKINVIDQKGIKLFLQTNTKGIDSNRHKREALVGKILSYYASAGKDPPIGLSASQDITALKKHLEHAKKLK